MSRVFGRKVAESLPDWEKFWSWLLMSAGGEDVYWSDTTLMHWLQAKENEYQSLSERAKKDED